jgi:hypothetical protein
MTTETRRTTSGGEPGTSDARLEATPHLEGLLRSLRGRLRRLVLSHGLGTVLAVVAGWLVFAYVADWGLRVPGPIRVLHGVVLVVLTGVFLWRSLFRPLRRVPDRPGLALLFERAHPELSELLISAVQFQAGRPHGDRQLVAAVLSEADARASTLLPRGILAEKRPRQRLGLGLLGAALISGFVLWQPEHARIFVDRMLGGSAAWPQRTHLTIEIPGLEARARVEESEDLIRLRVSRGTDVAIVVRAEGVVPDDVRLHFDGGRDLVLSRSGTHVFRTLLRSCQEDVTFHATGGDDLDGRPRVEVEVLQPPDVEGIAIRVEPPAYSGLPEELIFNRDVDVLAGSKLAIHVLPFPRDAGGAVRLLPDDLLVDVASAPFPLPPGTEGDAEDGLRFDLVAENSLGFRVELRDARGLENPDPGLFRVQVVADRAPEIQIVAPSRSDFEIVQGGAVPLRARVTDDFGLLSMDWRVLLTASTDELTEVASGSLDLRPIAEPGARGAPGAEPGAGPLRAALGAQRLEVGALDTPEHPLAVDQRYVFEFSARDNRAPEANVGESLPIRARVVTPEELLRRMQERLARARLDALRLSELQVEKRQRVEDLVDVFDGDAVSDGGEAVALAAALSGQRRVLGDAQALARDLATVAEDILYARLDEKAGPLLDYYDARASESTELRFSSEPWRLLASAAAEGQLGSSGFAQNLVHLVGLALEISEDHVAAAAEALDDAERALEHGPRLEALLAASELQTRSIGRIEALLEELAEWDNFQNILALTRDILNRQKALRERTQKFAQEK